MKSFFESVSQVIKNKESAVMVTVVASSGSTPRGDGAHMLITKDGLQAGTIGGGAVEYKAEQMAAEKLKTKNSGSHSFMLRRNEVEDLGMICGGDVEVFFSYLDPENPNVLSFSQAATTIAQSNEAAWLIMGISEESKNEIAIYQESKGMVGADIEEDIVLACDSKEKIVKVDSKKYFIEQIFEPGFVYIFGGGHVAQALVPILRSVNFRCVVIDDRPNFVNEKLFKGVEKTILLEALNDWHGFSITKDDYICIMTRGHAHDLECEYQALQTEAKYIGVIGSKHKIAGVNQKLKEKGISDDSLKRITTPIGLAIKAETPAEIAISITAQMIEVRAGDKVAKR
ncbi:MAG: XdhC family protein [Fastidiosipilaceae bacterium]